MSTTAAGEATALMKQAMWTIFDQRSGRLCNWIDHQLNQRFSLLDRGSIGNPVDDLVLDKETGLVWSRNANPLGTKNWLDSNTLCREFVLGNRRGWRLPRIEELSSLVIPGQSGPALPPGHPFVNVQHGAGVNSYWSSTNYQNPSGAAWFVEMGSGGAGLGDKSILGFVWPVRGGAGGNNWNW